MTIDSIKHPFAWYIHPGALVRARLPQFQGRCILCIGPSSAQFDDPEWAALGPVVTDLIALTNKSSFALAAEANRIETTFKLKQYSYVRKMQIPFRDTI